MVADSPPPPPPTDNKNPNISRILARASAAKAPDYPTWPSSSTGGSIIMTLPGRFAGERERLGPDFTEADRLWRVKWLKDQELHPTEPRIVDDLRYASKNPVRRFYMFPLNWIETNVLAPRLVSDGKIVLNTRLMELFIKGSQ